MTVRPTNWSRLDRFCDLLPVVSTATNLFHLFQKWAVLPTISGSGRQTSHYYTHLSQKSYPEMLILLIPVLGNIVVAFRKNRDTVSEVIASTPPIPLDFTKTTPLSKQKEAHEAAKGFLAEHLERIGAQVEFVLERVGSTPQFDQIEIQPDRLDSTIFSIEYTSGVLQDIQAAGQRLDDNPVVFGVASQFNNCESPSTYTVAPGHAVETYKLDRTQGPQAQLAFPDVQVELINCGGNWGFNGLVGVLSETTKIAVLHGYFLPNQTNAEELIQLLKTEEHVIEYTCVANRPLGGSKAVHLMLVAAPAFGIYNLTPPEKKERDEIEFLCALHSFRAQFANCISIAQKRQKPVLFKPAATGLGAFGNDPKNVAKGFYQAALEHMEDLKKDQVTVKFQVFKRDNTPEINGQIVADLLGLKSG